MGVAIPKTRWAKTVDGASIAYQELGHGEVTLVVVHPWASHLEVYWEQPRFAAFMQRLSHNLRVIHLDKRGMGMSDRIVGAPDVGLLMDDIRAVMDAAAVERAAVFGWAAPVGRRLPPSSPRPTRNAPWRSSSTAPCTIDGMTTVRGV